MFHTMGPGSPGSSMWGASAHEKERADTNYHFAILNILPLICPVLTLMHGLNREGLTFTMVSNKSSEEYFHGFEEETWPHSNCMGSVPAQDVSLLTP